MDNPVTITSRPYDWLKQISPALLEKDSVPLLGFPPEFPWEQFSAKMAELLKLDDLVIKPMSLLEWRNEADLSSGLGDQASLLQFSVAPLTGNLYWMMAQDDIAFLMSMLLTHQSQPPILLDADFQQGFYNYLALETLHVISQVNFDKGLTGHLLQNTSKPDLPVLCCDIGITVQQKTIWGRLLLSSELQRSWKERYGRRTLSPSSLSSNLSLITHMEIGRVAMTLTEWSEVALGDFIRLDSCSAEPYKEGSAVLTINGTSLFRAKIKEGKVEILERSLYQEVDETMGKEIPDDETEEEISSFEDFEDEDEDFEDEDEDEDADEDDWEEEEAIKEKWPPPPELPQRSSREKMAAEQQVQKESLEEEKEDNNLETDKEVSPLAEIPVSIVVEVGRFQMSVQKLLELQPGNLLELNVRPEDGVDLVVNGQRIAKAELLRIGEVLGVRILDKG